MQKKEKNWLTVLSIQYYNGNNESKRKVEEQITKIK